MRNNTMKNWKPIIAYLFIWLLIYGLFFVFCPGGEMDYWILSFWLVLPLAAIWTAYKLGKNHTWTIMQSALFAVFYGFMYILIRYVTFGPHTAEPYILLFGSLFFLCGFAAGRGKQNKIK